MHDERHNTCNIQCHTSIDFCNNGHQTNGPAYENTTTEGSKTSAATAAYTIDDLVFQC